MLISLEEYGIIHGRKPATIEYLVNNDYLKTNVKKGGEWLVDSDEPWPIKEEDFYSWKNDFRWSATSAQKTILAITRMENPYNMEYEEYTTYIDWLRNVAPQTVKEFIDLGKPEIVPLLVKYKVINKKNVTGFVEYAQGKRKFDMLSVLLNVANSLKNNSKALDIAKKKTADQLKAVKQEFADYKSVKTGDIVWLCTTPLPWEVLEKKNGVLTLISKFSIDRKGYHHPAVPIDYKDSNIRYWLNIDFYENMFSEKEKSMILTTHVGIEDSSVAYVEGYLKDKVYLLSEKEVMTYYKSEEDRRALVTQKARNRAYWESFETYNPWWLRSRIKDEGGRDFVNEVGKITDIGSIISSCYNGYGIRPVIKIECEDSHK